MKAIFAIVAVAVSAGMVPACATSPASPAYQGQSTDNKEALPEFACSGTPLELSKEQLEKLAFGEFERRSGRAIRPGEVGTKLHRRGCDWWVFVTLQPSAPGAHFGVLVDGLSGKVVRYMPGE